MKRRTRTARTPRLRDRRANLSPYHRYRKAPYDYRLMYASLPEDSPLAQHRARS